MAKAVVSYAKQAATVGNTTLHEPGTIKPQWVQPLARLSNNVDVRMSASQRGRDRGEQVVHVARHADTLSHSSSAARNGPRRLCCVCPIAKRTSTTDRIDTMI